MRLRPGYARPPPHPAQGAPHNRLPNLEKGVPLRRRYGVPFARRLTLYGAPHALILTTERGFGTYGALDCGIYTGILLLAAQSLGLAAIAQGAIAGCAPFVRTFFDLPENRVVLLGISFGYADQTHPANGFRTHRETLQSAAHWIDS